MNVIHERAPAELFAALAADATAAAAAAPAAPPSIGLISYELVGKKSFDLTPSPNPNPNPNPNP